MHAIPEARITDQGEADLPAAPRRPDRDPNRGDRATRPGRPAAENTPASRARRLVAHDAGASGRPAVRSLLPPQPPRRQRWRTVAGRSHAGRSLATFAPLAAALAALVVLLGDAATLVALATLTLAAATVATLLARREAARTAAAQVAQNRALTEELPFATYAARLADSQPEYVSPHIERLFETTAEQAFGVGDFWTPRLHPLDRERVLRHWRAWCADPAAKPFRRNYRLLTQSGRVIWVEDVTVLAGGATRATRTFQRHLLDVTERHQLEEQLREAQKHEALGRVAGAVAHDFNNLLTIVAGYSERLKSRLPELREREDAVAIAAAAARGTSLVRQLLSFTRPRPSDRRVLDVNGLVADFAPMVRRVIGEDIELVLGFERHPLPVEVDPARFDQVLMNLVVNARDAMPEGGRLTIGTAAVEVEGAGDGSVRAWNAVVTVSDTGTGMDDETAARIFEPYFTTKQEGRGSGLGLATAHGIVKEAGGVLEFSSAPGLGTTCWIHLPLAATEYEAPEEPQPVPTAAPRGQESILLVEDEAALRELEHVTLGDAGYEVHAAADAAEALDLAARHGVDLMVVDVVLPGMSGPQLVEELRTRGFDFPSVFVSGYGSEDFASRGFDAGPTTVIQKPFYPETLLRTVREELDRAAAAGPAPARAVTPIRREPHVPAAPQPVRCLRCHAHYRRPLPDFSLGGGCCPECDYVGWAAVV
jgi:signal transduction histidine kinase/DNA-binding NarL/FixJ family response regulator